MATFTDRRLYYRRDCVVPFGRTRAGSDARYMVVLYSGGRYCDMRHDFAGVSGSFLLVILGKYESVLNAVRTLDFRHRIPGRNRRGAGFGYLCPGC